MLTLRLIVLLSAKCWPSHIHTHTHTHIHAHAHRDTVALEVCSLPDSLACRWPRWRIPASKSRPSSPWLFFFRFSVRWVVEFRRRVRRPSPAVWYTSFCRLHKLCQVQYLRHWPGRGRGTSRLAALINFGHEKTSYWDKSTIVFFNLIKILHFLRLPYNLILISKRI